MQQSLFERFKSPASMMAAEQELLALGESAVPILETFFSGEAKNEFGIPFRQLGLPLRCALEVARRLGPIAKPLENHLRSELRAGHFVAAMALGSLGSLEESSVSELALSLSGDLDMSTESAVALIKCRQVENPLVLAAASQSEKVSEVLKRTSRYLSSQKPQ